MLERLKIKKKKWRLPNVELKIYPSSRSCVKPKMKRVRPEQMPPLMVRKAAWRR